MVLYIDCKHTRGGTCEHIRLSSGETREPGAFVSGDLTYLSHVAPYAAGEQAQMDSFISWGYSMYSALLHLSECCPC